jgi:hypothetical protein
MEPARRRRDRSLPVAPVGTAGHLLVTQTGMAEFGLVSTDVYGGVAVVNFADLTWRVALTRDFLPFEPIHAQETRVSPSSRFEVSRD